MIPKDVTCAPLKSTFFEVGICYCIVVRGDRRHLEILAVEAIIFVHETGGHWLKQATLALRKAFKKSIHN